MVGWTKPSGFSLGVAAARAVVTLLKEMPALATARWGASNKKWRPSPGRLTFGGEGSAGEDSCVRKVDDIEDAPDR